MPARELKCCIIAQVLNLPDALVVIGTPYSLLYVVLVHFSHGVLRAHRNVVAWARNHYFPWAPSAPNSPAPPSAGELDALGSLGHAVDGETVLHEFHLRKAVLAEAAGNGAPVMPIERLVPTVVSFWNLLKGGVDVTSRLIANIQAPVPSMNVSAKAIWRLTFIAFVQIFRLHQIFTVKTDDCTSWDQFLERRRQIEFRDVLGMLAKEIHKKMKSSGKTRQSAFSTSAASDSNDEASENAEPASSQVVTRSQSSLIYSLPSHRLGTLKTIQLSPHKRMRDSMGSAIVASPRDVKRAINCPRYPVFLVNARRKCTLCNKTTRWICLGCMHAFCVTPDTSDTLTLVSRDAPSKDIFQFKVSCWIQAHVLSEVLQNAL